MFLIYINFYLYIKIKIKMKTYNQFILSENLSSYKNNKSFLIWLEQKYPNKTKWSDEEINEGWRSFVAGGLMFLSLLTNAMPNTISNKDINNNNNNNIEQTKVNTKTNSEKTYTISIKKHLNKKQIKKILKNLKKEGYSTPSYVSISPYDFNFNEGDYLIVNYMSNTQSGLDFLLRTDVQRKISNREIDENSKVFYFYKNIGNKVDGVALVSKSIIKKPLQQSFQKIKQKVDQKVYQKVDQKVDNAKQNIDNVKQNVTKNF
jgi:hypothetical protein